MNLRAKLIAAFMLSGISFTAVSQISYNKRAMGSIGTVPKANDFLNGASLDNVDMSTGILRIGIPLYEIKVNDISVPISLNYTATGLKVNQEPSIVGMGWELTAGGKIITNVQGKTDAGNGVASLPTNFQWDNYSNRETIHKIVEGKIDNAWDTYNYILPNGGGTYTANGLTYPYDPSIIINHNNKQITTTDGVVYTFSEGEKKQNGKLIYYNTNTASVNPQFTGAGGVLEENPNQWYDFDLTKIKSTRFKDEVNFSYRTYDVSVPGDRPYLTAKRRTNVSESLPFLKEIVNYNHTAYSYTPVASVQLSEPIVSKSVTEYLASTVLTTIDYASGKVEFYYTLPTVTQRNRVTDIKIYKKENGTPVLLKRYCFDYDFNTQGIPYLKKIDIYDSKNVKVNYWAFTYKDYLPVDPAVGSNAQDRWGFYNGQTANKTLLEAPDSTYALKKVPFHNSLGGMSLYYSRSENTEIYGNNNPTTTVDGVTAMMIPYAKRMYNFGFAVMGTLETITTPLGAKYTYEYQPHTFNAEVYQPNSGTLGKFVTEGGGIRIKSILASMEHDALYDHLNSTEKAIKKVYSYGNAKKEYISTDTGDNDTLRNGRGQATVPQVMLASYAAYADNALGANGYHEVRNLLLLSHPINDLVQYNGSYVMYPAVTEDILKNATGGTSTHGRTIYFNKLQDPDSYIIPSFNTSAFANDTDTQPVPVMCASPGIAQVTIAGITGYNKYADVGGLFKQVEITEYTNQVILAPTDAVELSYKSLYTAVRGQVHGPWASQPLIVSGFNPNSTAKLDNAGNYVCDVFNALSNVTGTYGYGVMDYFTKTELFDDGLVVDYPAKYLVHGLNLNSLSAVVRRTSEHSIFLNATGTTSESFITYDFDNPRHMLPTAVTRTTKRPIDETGLQDVDKTIVRTKYAEDYTATSGMIGRMKTTKMAVTEPLEEYTTRKIADDYERVVSGTVNTFKPAGDVILPDKTYKMMVPDYFNATGIVTNLSDQSVYSSYLKQEMSYDEYLDGQIHQYTGREGGISNVILWGYGNQYPIAKVVNAGHPESRIINDHDYLISTDVSYTSFETSDFSNWNYSGTVTADVTTPSGKKVYNLGGGNITKGNATTAGSYIISYWYKTGSDVHVTVNGVNAPAEVVKNTYGGWILAEREITATTGNIVVSGTGYIDELRFHPKAAQMTTYIYEPQIGVTTVFDANGKAQYYEYDDSQRLKQIRDHNGNIVKAYEYRNAKLN